MDLSLLLLAAVAVAVATALALWARRWSPRMNVSRAALAADRLDGDSRLVKAVARQVVPVRLIGVGGARHRQDLTLISEQPDLDIGGVRARDLAPLVGVTAYLLYHPVYAQIWLRTGWRSVRRVVALARTELYRDYEFLMHDPDGIGVADGRHRDSAGTVHIRVSPRLGLYLKALVRPDPPRLGPGSTNPHGFA